MSATTFDENGQPEPGIHLSNNDIKAVNTLYGLIMGITADQVVTDSEINFLDVWLRNNADYLNAFPLNVIKRRVDDILTDQIITKDEREDLYQTLVQLLGNDFYETGVAGGISNGAIFEEPGFLSFKDVMFCLTGAFVSGPREKCEQALMKLGGIPTKSITKKLDYLVVGTTASRDWVASGHGRKIEKAMYYKEQGCSIAIISEEYLLKFIEL